MTQNSTTKIFYLSVLIVLVTNPLLAQQPYEVEHPVRSTFDEYHTSGETHTRTTHKLMGKVKRIVQIDSTINSRVKHIYEYNRKGSQIYYETLLMQNQEWQRNLSKRYTYDLQHRLKRLVKTEYFNNKASEVYVSRYNNNGFLIEAYDSLNRKSNTGVKYNERWRASELTYSYKAKGDEITMTKKPRSEYNISGRSQAYSFVARKDSLGRLIRMEVDNKFRDETISFQYSSDTLVYSTAQGHSSSRIEFVSDTANNELFEKAFHSGINQIGFSTSSSEKIIRFNERGHIVSIRQKHMQDYGNQVLFIPITTESNEVIEDDIPVVETFEYEYDETDNWTKRRCYNLGKLLHRTVTRTIVYY